MPLKHPNASPFRRGKKQPSVRGQAMITLRSGPTRGVVLPMPSRSVPKVPRSVGPHPTGPCRGGGKSRAARAWTRHESRTGQSKGNLAATRRAQSSNLARAPTWQDPIRRRRLPGRLGSGDPDWICLGGWGFPGLREPVLAREPFRVDCSPGSLAPNMTFRVPNRLSKASQSSSKAYI